MEFPNGLRLEENQIEHFQRVEQILLKYPYYIDTSLQGSGKSYIVTALALKYGFSLGIICPRITVSVWSQLETKYNLDVKFIVPYQKLRSISGKQPKHGLLTRNDSDTLTFSPTEKFLSLISEGLLLIFDEIQYIKNDNDQYKACQALTSACLSMGGLTRIGLLSGTPFDKEECAVNLARVLGLISSETLYTYRRDLLELKLLGAQELIDNCRQFDSLATQKILRSYPLDHKNVIGLCYRLYLSVIKPKIVSSMPPPRIDSEKDIKNGYYKISEEGSSKLEQAIRDLQRAARYNPITKIVDQRGVNWRAITYSHMNIEFTKIEIFLRLVRERFAAEPNAKQIIYVNYVESIKTLSDGLKEFHPAIMYGATPEKERINIIEMFNQDTNDLRLLIANIKVGGVGISLDDKIGNRPRYTYISPTYSILDLHQAIYRTHRHGTKSKATIRFVYGQVSVRETSILNALARKATVLQEVLDVQREYGILFPGEFKDEFEV
jgi:hypothetical protein